MLIVQLASIYVFFHVIAGREFFTKTYRYLEFHINSHALVTRCKIRSLLVAEVARCKKSLVTRCKIRSLLVSKIHLLFIGQLISITTYYVKSLLTRANFS